MLIAKNISLYFGKKKLFSEIDFSLEKNEKVLIKGESGTGKSSFLKVLCGVLVSKTGEIKFDDLTLNKQNIDEIRKQTCYVPQKISVFDVEDTVEDFLLFPFGFKINKKFKPSRNLLSEKLEEIGIKETFLDKYFYQLSGGEQQRISLLRGLLLKRKYSFFDEITSAVDSKNKTAVIKTVIKNSQSTLIVSHDKEWENFVDKVYLFDGEKLCIQ